MRLYGHIGGVPKSDFARKHDVILRYGKTLGITFNADAVRIPYSDDSSERLKYKARAFRGERTYDTYEPNPQGKHPEDWWAMQPIMPSSKERLGYPTQKPLALYERIIKASSNLGDLILDPFAGCATTCVAAERLGRQWVGIDPNEPARDIIHDRLQREVSESMAWGEIVRTPTEPAYPHGRGRCCRAGTTPCQPQAQCPTATRAGDTGTVDYLGRDALSRMRLGTAVLGLSPSRSQETALPRRRGRHGQPNATL